jgi:histidyl-tRNA synthetase
MRLRNWVCDAWRRVSLRNGFEEYDAPIFEYLDLFTIKSGEEIAEQLFSLTDRGGRNLAIRPEMTPSLARMVNAKINSLPRPIKWFSIVRCCRAERPQKGRLREFFQWNIDVIGSDEVLADAECIFVCVDFLREIGLKPDDVQIRIGSRAVAMARLRKGGVPEEQMETALLLLDKRPKVTDEEFAALCEKAGITGELVALLNEFEEEARRNSENRDPGLSRFVLSGKEAGPAYKDLTRLMGYIESFGIAEYCTLDLRIVRGLAYYTGIVYEIFDAAQSLRAVGGGGRYDNLLEVLDGPKLGGTGFGMGDVVLSILLDQKGKLPEFPPVLDFFVIADEGVELERVLEIAGELRSKGKAVEFSYAKRSLVKQLKEANKRGSAGALILRTDGIFLKDLATGEQKETTLEELLRRIKPD